MRKSLILMLCALLTIAALAGCGKKKAKVMVSDALADSGLLAQLSEAFTAETGYTVEFESKNRAASEKALEKNDFDAALVITNNAAEKIGSGQWFGGPVFYDTLYLIGPQNDPASARHLGQYATRDILKHLTLTGFSFVHPNITTPLGIKDVSLWLMVDATPNEEQFLLAPDDAQQMIALANGQGAYALVDRAAWTQYGGEASNSAVLLSGIAGIMDQYTVLAKQIKEGEEPSAAQAFCQWMMGQSARNIVVNYREPDSAVAAYESNIPAQ